MAPSIKRFNTDLVKLVGQYTKLKQVGKTDNFIGLCPFHEEKTPSFVVNKKNQMFYCFGCGRNGNYDGFERDMDHAKKHLSLLFTPGKFYPL